MTWPTACPTRAHEVQRAPQQIMITNVAAVPTNDPIAIAANRSSAWHSAYRMPVTAATNGDRRHDVQVLDGEIVAGGSRPGPAIEISGWRTRPGGPTRAMPASPIHASTAPDEAARLASPGVSRVSTYAGHHRRHDPAGEDARQRRRQDHRDQQRVEVPRQADLRGDVQLAQDADGLDGDGAAGQDRRRAADGPEGRLGVAGGARRRLAVGAHADVGPSALNRRPRALAPDTTRPCGRSPRRTAP